MERCSTLPHYTGQRAMKILLPHCKANMAAKLHHYPMTLPRALGRGTASLHYLAMGGCGH